MLTTLGTPAVLALALLASPAAADHATLDCEFDTIAQETLTGSRDTFVGLAYGYVASGTDEAVSIRCYVTVDGVASASTGTGTGTRVAVAHGQVTYTANDWQDVALCAEWTAGLEGGTTCEPTETTQIPPQETIDLVDDLYRQVADLLIWIGPYELPSACWVLQQLSPGVPGVVDIRTDGDVYLAGIHFWDCPPYEV